MDKEVRNILQRATQDARRLLEDEYREQLEGTFDILLDGTIGKESGSHLDAVQRLTRQKLVAAVEHNRASGITSAEAVAMYLREAAFTTLNRFAALKMLEARGLVQECISKGEQSAGFKEFCGLAAGLASLPDKGYRLYIENIFDEIGREVRVLFNRLDAVSLLWPRRLAFNALLDVLNQSDLASVWDEDETIGWVYQYFNSQEERRQMRDESSAPRNSRELAVRNQFFTPRYVVEFLTDNTLGRIWYEMRRGNTKLSEDCRYLVRRPMEIFLGDLAEAYKYLWGIPEDGKIEPSATVAAAFRGDLSNLPENMGPEAYWISLAIPPDQFEKYTGIPWQPFDSGPCDGLLEHLNAPLNVQYANDVTRLWMALCAFRLTDSGSPYGYKSFDILWQGFREAAQREHESCDDITQAELLKIPSYIPHRPKKDPREIRMLDPAGGSGHFGLYCFDLFMVIYAEAYDDPDLGPSLKKDYPDKDVYLREVPRLILAHNIHIIDIDPRAVQIAGLALWLRAQRAYNNMNMLRGQRPSITKTNVVCAEPMPGEKGMFEEFLKGLREDRLENLMRRALEIPLDRQVRATKAMADSLCALARTVWESMTFAGEAGSLLKIEEDIAQSIRKSRATWEDKSPLFRFTEFSLEGKTIDRYVKFVDGDENDFWESAEQLVLAAMKEFAQRVSNERTVSRRLFADDAVHGFAFINICRKRYDVTLMNPPFGEWAAGVKSWSVKTYPRTKNDIYAAFVERGLNLLAKRGILGAITSRTGFFLTSFQKWREEILLKEAQPTVVADLGYGVMDAAMVEAAAYCLERLPHAS